MNIHQLRCAVTVARLGSQTRAAEALYMSQPNLSKALKELEQTCGFRIFARTGTGMTPTQKGEEFLNRARAVLEQMDAIDAIYQGHSKTTADLSLAAPHAGYISCALADCANALNAKDGLEMNIQEAGTAEVIRRVLSREADIGIVRYPVAQQNRVLGELAEQGLHYILYWTFRHVAVMSRRHPLAREKCVDQARLAPYIEIVQGDMPSPVQPDLSTAVMEPRRIIRMDGRGSCMALLERSPNTYLWSSPAPKELLERHGLVQLESSDAGGNYQDALIFIKGYAMSRWEQAFYDHLRQVIERL